MRPALLIAWCTAFALLGPRWTGAQNHPPRDLASAVSSPAGPAAMTPGAAPVDGPTAAPPSRSDWEREELLRALDAYDRAVEQGRDNPEQAGALYVEAARGFESLRAAGVRNASLEYNLGNTYFRLGDLGRSVLHFRRAQRLDPANADVSANLNYVRLRVEPQVESTTRDQLLRRLLFWQDRTSMQERFWSAAILSGVGWLMLVARLGLRSGALAWVGSACVLLGLANGGLVLWQLHDEHARPPAVIVRGQPVLREGRGEGYDAVRREPLGAGVELRLLDRRGDWIQVRLRNDQSGWIPAASVEPV
jgi:hypothetical protein